MDVLAALAANRTIDITTTGARSGRPRRIEIWARLAGDRVYLTGTPGRRDWYANLRAHPEFTLHLKHDVQADVPARGRPVVDRAERRAVFEQLRPADADSWAAGSPLVEVELLPDH